MRPRLAATALTAAALLGGCRPNTTRPAITPYPEAASTEIRLSPQEATRRLAEALEADSLTPSRVRVRDGYLETRWLDSASGRPTARRPLGTDVVRIRAWADPGRPGNTLLIVETLYRPLADPSLPERELERQVPRDHPVALKVEQTLEAMLKRFGGPPRDQPQPAGARPGLREAPDGVEESEGIEETEDAGTPGE
jgi:hypothetical protein